MFERALAFEVDSWKGGGTGVLRKSEVDGELVAEEVDAAGREEVTPFVNRSASPLAADVEPVSRSSNDLLLLGRSGGANAFTSAPAVCVASVWMPEAVGVLLSSTSIPSMISSSYVVSPAGASEKRLSRPGSLPI